jgi:hypothetical protein
MDRAVMSVGRRVPKKGSARAVRDSPIRRYRPGQQTRRLTPAGFSVTFAIMAERSDDELKLLARAFDRAWKRYYRPSRIGAISESVARPVLAKHLVALAKEGVVSLDALAEAGLLHLVSLTPEAQHWGHLRIEGAGARFQREWHVRFTLKASKAA